MKGMKTRYQWVEVMSLFLKTLIWLVIGWWLGFEMELQFRSFSKLYLILGFLIFFGSIGR